MKSLALALLASAATLAAQAQTPTATPATTSTSATNATVNATGNATASSNALALPNSIAQTAPRAGRTPPDTHGLDMRTQSGPAETMSTRGYSPPIPVDANLPTLWIIGDSTVRNGSPGNGATSGQWGWGAPLTFYFDPAKINVVNRALGGTHSHGYYDENWKTVLPLIKKGDFVMMQFGANDNGGRSLAGAGDNEQNGTHSFGWYLKQIVNETREKGATPIICSLTPRANFRADGTFTRSNTTHAAWAAEVAKETNTPFIDLYERIARKSEELGKEKTATLYSPPGEVLHTNWDGAVINAECVVSGLKSLKDDPLAKYYSPKGQAIAAIDVSKPVATAAPATSPTATSAAAPAATPAAAPSTPVTTPAAK